MSPSSNYIPALFKACNFKFLQFQAKMFCPQQKERRDISLSLLLLTNLKEVGILCFAAHFSGPEHPRWPPSITMAMLHPNPCHHPLASSKKHIGAHLALTAIKEKMTPRWSSLLIHVSQSALKQQLFLFHGACFSGTCPLHPVWLDFYCSNCKLNFG